MTKIKIVHILHSVGGVDVSLRLIVENINPTVFENVIIHGINDTKHTFFDLNQEKIKDYNIPIFREISFLNDFKSIFNAYFIIKKERPNLIHTHSAKGGIIGRLVGFLTGIKVLHTPQAFSYLSTSNAVKRYFFLTIERLFSKGNNLLLASSKSELNRAIDEVGFKKEKVILFSNSIKPIERISELTISATWPKNYICTVGRPSFQKNIEWMIQIIFEIKKTQQDIHLVVMGIGYHSDLLKNVKKLILNFDLSNNITLLNWTSQSDVYNIISKSQLYISTSRYEGLPYSVIESLALSIPCVVSNCDGNRDLIINGYNGYVIEKENTNEFSKKIIELTTNKNTYAYFSKNAKDSFFKNYNMKNNNSLLNAKIDFCKSIVQNSDNNITK